MARVFLNPSDPILNAVVKKIVTSEITSAGLQEIINHMIQIAYGEQKERSKPVMVGLAAPQIGISKRIILIDINADGKGRIGNLRVYINPKIIWTSKGEEEWYEGCYSTSNVCGVVSRPVSIKIQAYTPKGKLMREKHKGYVARIFQHEIDHLDGKRFPDLIKDPDKLHWVRKNEFPLYRNRQAWRNWPKKCSLEKWKTIKNPLLKDA